MNELPGFSGPNRDFYSILQVERNSDLKTIQRVKKLNNIIGLQEISIKVSS